MTRFARATGSKSSNARVTEEATDWKDLKRQLEQKNSDQNQNDRSGQGVVKPIKPKFENESSWADFGNSQSNMNSKPRESKKRKTSTNDSEEQISVPSKKQKKKKGNKCTEDYKQQIDSIDHQSIENTCEPRDEKLNETKTMFNGKQKSKSEPSREKYPTNKQRNSAAGNEAPHFKRRKPYIESSTIHINGVTINVSKFDGFDVKTDDAQRLKELRLKMLKEGIPRIEVDKVMKLERRKAEKALAREKKKVCFNCRKAGHLLSECPEVGSFESKSFDSSAVNLCYKCGSTEHTYYQCRVQKKEKYSFATCFICKEQGHISSQCPDNPKGLYPQGGSCKVCGEVTHLKKDCPQLSTKKSENAVTLDTLASGSNVESLGEEEKSTKQEKKISVKKSKIIKF